MDTTRRITYWNKASESISGFPSSEVMGKCCSDNILKHVNEAGMNLCISMCPLAYTIQDGKPRRANVYLHHKNGYRVPVVVNAIPLHGENGEIVGAIESFTDNSGYLNAMERVQYLGEAAFQDSLTGIGNRRFVEMKLSRGVSEARQFDAHIGLLMFDIDNFKAFNDTYGQKPITGAPPPINPVRSNETVTKDPEKMSQAEYNDWVVKQGARRF